MKLLIKGGHVIDPKNGIDKQCDILVAEGKIAQVGNVDTLADEIIDAAGMTVMPGFVDMHTHLREPGFEYKETIASGTAAAAAGGYTAVACMANTDPVADTPSVIEYIKAQAAEAAKAKVYPIAAVTKGLMGTELTEMSALKEAGAIAFSDDGKPVSSSKMMAMALKYAKNFNALIISHCEDMALAEGGAVNESYTAVLQGLRGISPAAEEIMVSRDILLAEVYDCRVHIAHVSTQGSVRQIREAKKRGVKVTCETAPHYFSATDELTLGFNTLAKVNPPLRTAEDVQAIKQGLSDGTIDCIATDHAPHHFDEKECEYDRAANGISGLETSFSLGYTHLVKTGALQLHDLVRLLACAPADILGIPSGTLSVGAAADITIADLKAKYTVYAGKFISKGKNTPFDGAVLCGRVMRTLLDGKTVYNAVERG